jgi:hypothetical protein
MQVPPGNRFSRLRHFHGVGRYPGTFQYAAAELNLEGTDYDLLSDDPKEALQAPCLGTVREILSQGAAALTRLEILLRWPETASPPHPDTLCRTLKHGCETGILVRTGEGTKAEAFRYGLAKRSVGGQMTDEGNISGQ